MATVYAVKSGSWEDPTVWNTGVLPGANDDVFSNEFEVFISTDIQAKSLNATGPLGTERAEPFTINWLTDEATAETRTVTADIFGGGQGVSGTTPCLRTEYEHNGVNKTLRIFGNITGGHYVDSYGLSSTANTEITGNIYAGDGIIALGGIFFSMDPDDRTYVKIVGNLYASEMCAAIASQLARVGIDGHGEAHPTGGSPIQSSSYGPLPGGVLTMSAYLIDYDNREIGERVVYTIDGGGGGIPGEGLPATSDVRAGVAFGTSLVGTLAVPTPNQVAFGVPVDATTGQAAIDLSQLSTITGTQIASAFEK